LSLLNTSDYFAQLKEDVYHYIFRVAIDVLPVRASAVLCESAFSLSKQICTPERNWLHPALMEVLQLLKYMYRQDRLDFMRDLLADKKDYQIEGEVSERAVHELFIAG
jgi:hAT family C-terminal dimerisation region